jgi:hypothetical protein
MGLSTSNQWLDVKTWSYSRDGNKLDRLLLVNKILYKLNLYSIDTYQITLTKNISESSPKTAPKSKLGDFIRKKLL